MFKRGIMLGVAACLVAALVLSVALGQNRTAGQRGNRQAQAGAPAGQRGGQPGGQGQRFDPAQMQQMMEQRMKEQLGATDAEWKTLGPRVMKVDQLNRQVSGSGRGGMMFGGRRGPQGDQPGAGQGAEVSAMEKASQQLRTTLNNTSATPDQIKKDLTALRAAKEKAKQELVAAQQELKKTVNPRQEAQLVLMGLLD